MNPYLKARQDAGLSQRQAAKLLGTFPATVCEWETTTRKPTQKYILRMVQVYGKPLDQLMVQDSSNAPTPPSAA